MGTEKKDHEGKEEFDWEKYFPKEDEYVGISSLEDIFLPEFFEKSKGINTNQKEPKTEKD